MSERYAQSVAADPENREPDDFYPTPPHAIHALLALETFGTDIWEPACGDGAISKVLIERGFNVVSTDLVDRGYGTPRVDFLMERRLLAPQIITNPPFKLAEQFVTHALDLGARRIALLLRLAFLEGTGRMALFDYTPLARVHVSSRRINFMRGGIDGGRGGGSMIAFAWFFWERGHVGPPSLRFFDWADYSPIPKGEAKAAESGPTMPLFE